MAVWPLKAVPFQASDQGPQAWVASDEVFTADQLDRILTLPQPTLVAALSGNRVAPEVRDSRVVFVEPAPETEWLFDILDDAVRQVVGHFFMKLTEIAPLQLTEYDAAYQGHYVPHVDCGYGLSPSARRKLSIAVQLSDAAEYEGGELQLFPEGLKPVRIPKQRGMVAFFRAHVLHGVTPVTAGKRKSLVVWVGGPPELE